MADADVESRARICEMLVGDGYEARTASSGEDVLSVLAVERVDAVVLGDDLGAQGGLETCRRIRNESVQRFSLNCLLTCSAIEAHQFLRAISANPPASYRIHRCRPPGNGHHRPPSHGR